jgi:hypothetical protein
MHSEILDRVKALLPQTLHARAVIAGGAAADLGKATDIDVFVLGARGKTVISRQITTYLRDFVDTAFVDHRYDENKGYDKSRDDFEKIATIGGALWPVQIIAVDQETVADLLNRFDISVHQVAVTLDGRKVVVPTTTRVIQQPRLISPKYSAKFTLERLKRLCSRYGFKPHPDDVAALEPRIAA